MRIKTHLGVSADGFISSADGRPAFLSMPTFDPGQSHGYPEYIADCGAVVMGRTTFEPALGAPSWPWPGLRVFVLTSRPLPSGTPSDVVAAAKPAELLDLMRQADFPGDVDLVGGQRTIDAFRGIGALDVLGIVTLPILLGEGTRLTPPASDPQFLRLDSTRTFPDGAVEQVYRLAAPVS
ncbi:dihydrofolate reductase family protein [Kutzneria viridogrisea]